MSELIDELKKEHQILAGDLTEVRRLGLVSEEGKKLLFECKSALLAHLAKEDAKLYPLLNTAAESDEKLKHLIETFAKDMDIVSTAALDFFAKYEKDPANPDFASDMAHLLSALSNRISKEEHLLYPEYDKRA